jgi:lipopolysaccharide export system permease protein
MRLPHISRLDRYLFRQLLTALLAVTLCMVALTWLTQSLRLIEVVVNRGLSIGVFFELSSLLIPSFLAVILPITSFVAVLFVYLRLAGDRELTVMRAAGVSQIGLARPALVLTVLVMAFGYTLSLWIVPASEGAFREYQFEIRNRLAAFLLQAGVFTPVMDDLVVYVRSRDRDGTLHGILVDDSRQPDHHATILAESGHLVDAGDTPRVVLLNGSREEIDARTGGLSVVTFTSYSLDLTQPARSEGPRLQDIGEMSLGQLLHPPPFLANGRDVSRLVVEAHKRLSSPLDSASFVMIALAAVLTGTFRRHGGLMRPMVAIMCAVVLVALGLALDSLSVRYVALIPLIWVRAALPAALAAVYLFAPRLRHGAGRLVPGLGGTH